MPPPLAPPRSTPARERAIDTLASRAWDVLVVGGGATGTALARDAALRGLAVALVERHDLAFGTSSRSSRLIHGGLRYLAQLQLGQVREGLVERGRLLAAAPGLVRPVPFLYPVYEGDPDPLWRVHLGVGLYHALAAGHSLGRRRRLSAAELAAEVPGLRTAGLRGAAGYVDAACHDARLVIAQARSARDAGATIVTRCSAVNAPGRGAGRPLRELELEDTVGSRRFPVRARAVVLCCGPWGELLAGTPIQLRTTRGSHVAVPHAHLPLPCHLALRSPDDGRLAFAMPVGEHTVFGTTDVDDATPPAETAATPADVAYLLRLANHAFPEAALTPSHLTGVFAGLRPLVAVGSRHHRIRPTRVPRSHVVVHAGEGLWVLAGGKLTSARRMAEDCLDAVLAAPGAPRAGLCRTRDLPFFPGSVDDGRERLMLAGEEEEKEKAQVGRKGEAGEGLLAAQVRWAAEDEWALALDDLLLRRVAPGALDLVGCREGAVRAAGLLGKVLRWTEEEREEQVTEFVSAVDRELSSALSGA